MCACVLNVVWCVRECVSVCMCVECGCVRECKCVECGVYVSVYLCMRVYMCTCVSVCGHGACICARVHVCLCAGIHTCV